MKNILKISDAGEDLISSMDDDTNRLFINDTEIDPEDWTGSGSYTATVEGHEITIVKVADATGNVGIRRTDEFTYSLFKHKSADMALIDAIYPVGSIYLSVNNADPADLFGGSWEQIKDTFLLSAGDTYAAGDTGGEAEHTLTESEMPSHSGHVYGGGSGSNYYLPSSALIEYTNNGHYWNIEAGNEARMTRQNIGGGLAHNNLPPYLAVYMWKRTA